MVKLDALSSKSLRDLTVIACLTLIVMLALAIRLQPLKYGPYLYEYDPYFMLYVTKYLVEHGPLSWFELTKDNVKNFWYPIGRDVYSTEFPGVPFIGYFTYSILRPLTPWMDEDELLIMVCNVLPPIFGGIAVIFAFLIGREIKDERVGLLSALFTAISPAAIDRTIAGFYTKLGFGVTIYVASLYFLVRSLKSGKYIHMILAGLLLGLLGATWGGVSFAILSYSIILVTLVLFNMNDKRISLTFTIIFAIALIAYTLIPKLGVKYVVKNVGLLAVLTLIFSYVDLYLRARGLEARVRIPTLLTMVLISLGAFFTASRLGIIALPSRQLSIIFPWVREENVVFVSVAEHHPPSWDQLFTALSAPFIFTPIGLYLLFSSRRPETYSLIIPVLGSVYGVSSAAYLMNLAGPLTSIAGALGLTKLVELSVSELTKKRPIHKKKAKGYIKIRPQPLLAALAIIIITVGFLAPLSANAGDQVPTILASGVPYRIVNKAWIKALSYMRESLPENAVVVTWWDYGYWVTVVGNKTSVADNATINGTQLAILGRALMSDELTAAKIMINDLKTPPNATYVVAYEAFIYANNYLMLQSVADIAKSYWMVRIGGLNVSDYFDVRTGAINWTSNASREALLYNIIWDSAIRVGTEIGAVPSLVVGGNLLPFFQAGIHAKLDLFTPEYIAWEETKIEAISIIVIVGLYKLNSTALEALE